MWQKVQQYLSLIKFSHSVFALPFALIGLRLGVLAYDYPGSIYLGRWINSGLVISGETIFLKTILVILCMLFARSAAMAYNRYLDRNIDAKNPRTAIREIPSGVIKADNAFIFTIITSLLFILCSALLNWLCFALSFVALAVILGYSYTKRFTPLCHLVLGLGLSLAPIGAYLAVTGYFDWLPILFSFVVLFWVSGFDIIYALQDEEFDKENNLNSIPVYLGRKNALLLSRVLHGLVAIIIVLIGLTYPFGFGYFLGAFVFISLLIWQHSIIKANDLSRINLAFFTLNGIASILFAILVLLDLL
jgi:4-hydroxybenzoate polyprenyltransferase